MYDEANVVQHNIDVIKKYYGNNSFIVVIQSDSGQEITGADVFKVLPNLSAQLDPYKLAANAVVRNYNEAFFQLYQNISHLRYVVALTGDTYISDASGLDRLYKKMIDAEKLICVSQAIGQNFHSKYADPPRKIEGRYQHDGISDFMPQFFLIEGNFAHHIKLFASTRVTNEFCTEQCLGDELVVNTVRPFYKNAYIIAKNAYDYNDGIIYNKND
jgi:hypothetical protein